MEERFRNLDYQNWKPVRTLGTDSYGTVYEIARDDGFGMVDHAALKVLSIPAAPEDFDALVAEGRTPEEVTALLHRQVETIARQLMAVDAISDEPNLLRCEDHVIRAHPDGRWQRRRRLALGHRAGTNDHAHPGPDRPQPCDS